MVPKYQQIRNRISEYLSTISTGLVTSIGGGMGGRA